MIAIRETENNAASSVAIGDQYTYHDVTYADILAPEQLICTSQKKSTWNEKGLIYDPESEKANPK